MLLQMSHKTVDQLHTVSTLCLVAHQIKPDDLEVVGGLSDVCSQMVLKCLLRLSGSQD